MAGVFISFEGGEGAGKSTQAQRLSTYLTKKGTTVVLTREPGGTPEAELLRKLLVSGDVAVWHPIEEALLNYAARSHHLNHLIRPALNRGNWVICDRFMDSTRVYQGVAGGVAAEFIDQLESVIVGITRPQLTFIFDLAPEIGLKRANSRLQDGNDRFERKGLGFHQRLRDGFLEIAQRNPERCVVIDASLDTERVWELVARAVSERFHV